MAKKVLEVEFEHQNAEDKDAKYATASLAISDLVDGIRDISDEAMDAVVWYTRDHWFDKCRIRAEEYSDRHIFITLIPKPEVPECRADITQIINQINLDEKPPDLRAEYGLYNDALVYHIFPEPALSPQPAV